MKRIPIICLDCVWRDYIECVNPNCDIRELVDAGFNFDNKCEFKSLK